MVDLGFLFYVLIFLLTGSIIAVIVRRNFSLMFYYIIGLVSLLLTLLVFLAEVFDAR